MANAKPIGVGVGIEVAVEIGKRKSAAISIPIASNWLKGIRGRDKPWPE